MKNKYAHTFAVILILLLISVILWRKHTGKTNSIVVSTPQPGVTALMMDAGKLRESESIWANQAYLEIARHQEIQSLLGDLVEQLQLTEKAKVAASNSCWRMLLAYGSGDWNIFRSVRIPVKGYEINMQMVKALKVDAPDNSSEALIEIYHDVWNNTYKKTALFNEVSMGSNAVSLIALPLKDIGGVSFPQFTTPANQNWLNISPTSFFDYGKIMSNRSNHVQVLRFFFFGKTGKEARPYLITFVWNEDDSVWLPWRMRIAFVTRPLRDVVTF